MALTDPHQFALTSSMSAKSAYLYLLSVNFVPPHCEEKFLPLYSSLYWPTIWRQLSFCPLDRPVIDVAWQVAHGVLYTADRLVSFGYDYDPNCFCGALETPSHLFFECALAQIQSLMFRTSSLCPPLLCHHVLFGFSASELAVVPRVFVYLLNLQPRTKLMRQFHLFSNFCALLPSPLNTKSKPPPHPLFKVALV